MPICGMIGASLRTISLRRRDPSDRLSPVGPESTAVEMVLQVPDEVVEDDDELSVALVWLALALGVTLGVGVGFPPPEPGAGGTAGNIGMPAAGNRPPAKAQPKPPAPMTMGIGMPLEVDVTVVVPVIVA